MKNIQVIDGADNCTYEIYSATDREFKTIFPNGQDIEFIDELVNRLGKKKASKLLASLWKRRQNKKSIKGLHGRCFMNFPLKNNTTQQKKKQKR